MFCDAPRTAFARAGSVLALCGALGAAQAQPTPSQAPPPAAIGVVAPGHCWRQVSADTPLDKHLARCAALGIDMVRLQLQSRPDGTVEACAAENACGPLTTVLAATPSPTLLLDTPVGLLDTVQRDVDRVRAADRVRVSPQTHRPVASAAPRLLAPGVRYWA